ncbi:MAG: hypothetical protein JNM41_13490 [Flavipsychrobacter sp.]|nr:hypothetical protein [Flavipsychrobacter sp.]
MVTVIGYNIRTQKDNEQKTYISLELEGDIEMVQSQATGRFYATVRRCAISSTFDQLTAERMVGKQMPGSIERVPCEPYDYTIEATGEAIKIGYRWGYVPEGAMRIPAVRRIVNQPKEQEEDSLQEQPLVK